MKSDLLSLPDDLSVCDVMSVLQSAIQQLSINDNVNILNSNVIKETLINWSQCYLPHYFVLPPSEMHYWLAKALDRATENRNTKINLLAPRCSAKSTLGTLAFPLREAIENREKYIWIISDTKSQALSHLSNIAYELLNNQKLRKSYSFLKNKNAVRFKGNSIFIINGSLIESYGTGQRIRGRRFKENRPSLIICDDIQNEDHILSINRRNRTRQWFYGSLMKAGNSQTNFLQLATALHQEAIAIELTHNQGWTSKVFKSFIKDPIRKDLWNKWETIFCNANLNNSSEEAFKFYRTHQQEMDFGAEVLWKENESIYDLMKMKIENGEQAFLREKQNSPINYDLCEFAEKYFQENIWCEQIPAKSVLKVLTLDPSKGKESNIGDYTAFVFAVLGNDGLIYIDSDISKKPLSEIIDYSITLLQKYSPDIYGIETNQFQELIKIELEKKLRENNIYDLQPYPIINRTNKVYRIRRLEPYLSMNKLRFLKNSKSNQLLLEQLKYFPLGDHDDGPDTLEMAVRLIDMFQNQSVPHDTLGDKLNINVM